LSHLLASLEGLSHLVATFKAIHAHRKLDVRTASLMSAPQGLCPRRKIYVRAARFMSAPQAGCPRRKHDKFEDGELLSSVVSGHVA
jgi:hypothetical protein